MKQRSFNLQASMCLVSPVECRKHANRREEPGTQICRWDACARRRPSLLARDAHSTSHSLHDHIHSSPTRLGALHAESRDIARDDTWTDFQERSMVYPQPFRHARTEVVHDDVRNSHEIVKYRKPIWVLQVDNHATLIPIDA